MPGFGENISESNALIIKPNPSSNGQVNCIFYSDKSMEAQVNIFDTAGRNVFSKMLYAEKGENNRMIETNLLSAGAYSVTITIDDNIITGNLIILE
jgi:hypothetical protein